jgi:transcriptional regulator with PAS, ATPase and Fis domain
MPRTGPAGLKRPEELFSSAIGDSTFDAEHSGGPANQGDASRQHAAPVDIRLIAATNMPIHRTVTDEFRQDASRINGEINAASARAQVDIPLLVDHFLEIHARKYHKSIQGVAPATASLLERHSWPGNVRELQHALERAVIMSGSTVLQPQDFFLSSGDGGGDDLAIQDYNLEQVERLVVLKALRKHQGNVSRAAVESGLTAPVIAACRSMVSKF